MWLVYAFYIKTSQRTRAHVRARTHARMHTHLLLCEMCSRHRKNAISLIMLENLNILFLICRHLKTHLHNLAYHPNSLDVPPCVDTSQF